MLCARKYRNVFVVYLYWAQQKVCDITQKTVSNDGGR